MNPRAGAHGSPRGVSRRRPQAPARAPADLTAADDAQRYLLRAVLADACERHHAVLDGCPDCQAARGCCLPHWDTHQKPCDAYSDLAQQLAGYEGSVRPCPLDAGQRLLIMTALGEAITYRAYRATLRSPADIALTAAYRALARQVTS